MILYRPVGLKELELIAQSGFRAFPPRLPGQPILYRVLNSVLSSKSIDEVSEMKTRWLMLWWSLLSVLLAFLPTPTHACSCATETPCEAFNDAAAVFVGRMLEGSEEVTTEEMEGQTVLYEAGVVRFSVEEAFKGVDTADVPIHVDSMKHTSCGPYGLVRGEQYVVYAYSRKETGLTIGPCTRTPRAKYADEDLRFLRGLREKESGGHLYGTIKLDSGGRNNPAMPGITVVIKNAQKQLEVSTDSGGAFEIKGLAPGTYNIEPKLPEHYILEYPIQEVHISDRGCKRVFARVKVNGRVSGKLRDASGRPAPATPYLVSADQSNHRIYGDVEESGSFEVKNVPAGRYWLHVDLISNGKKEHYYYPGVWSREAAAVIEVGMGQKLTGYEFSLLAAFKVQTVQGTVMYSDGRPVEDAEVQLEIPEGENTRGYRTYDLLSSTSTDKQGRFTLQGYQGNTYEISAREDLSNVREKGKPLESEPLKVELGADVADLKLVLPLPKPTEAHPNARSEKGKSKITGPERKP